jgi:hypothetical protein
MCLYFTQVLAVQAFMHGVIIPKVFVVPALIQVLAVPALIQVLVVPALIQVLVVPALL